jgi:hypothetical protein
MAPFDRSVVLSQVEFVDLHSDCTQKNYTVSNCVNYSIERDNMSTRYSWMKKRSKQQPIRVLAGHPLELHAVKYFEELSDEQEVSWTVARQTYRGPVLEWTPRSPGIYNIILQVAGSRSWTLQVLVGLRPQDLVDLRDHLDYYFCLVARHGMKLHFIPLLERDTAGEPPSREKLRREVEQHHPAFAELMRAHTSIYPRDAQRGIKQASRLRGKCFSQDLLQEISHALTKQNRFAILFS